MAVGMPTHKVILCGEYGVGKSSIFRRFLDNSFTEDTGPKSTIGLDHFSKEFTTSSGKKLRLVLWDTAGIERFATLSSSYYQSASAAILCYSIANRDSFNMLSQHLLETAMNMRTGKIILCGNKQDLESAVSEEDVVDFCNQCDSVISKVFRISCKEGDGVRELFHAIAEVLQKDAEERFDANRIQPHFDPCGLQPNKSECC
ncbi:hypothetical protein CAPTEDRAFT_171398 [Capitella teleta]|uniref:Uncharacterized protein n=1 Tax=Capitella teleta TaxID=283909 RepID=R7T3N6_CAPTE|nr:hypothetical protein CAPTEDRAFT_171398 [Capitella teleta]|eukprot:ELT87407.1 hypothetical protein CAPTEDRAFT_171398 [Capitella teleta]